MQLKSFCVCECMCPNLECYAQAVSHLQPTRDVPLQNQKKVDPKQWEQIFWIFPCGSDNFWRLKPCNFLILCAPSWQGQSLQEELHREVLTVGHWAYPGVIPLIFQSWSCFVARIGCTMALLDFGKQFWYSNSIYNFELKTHVCSQKVHRHFKLLLGLSISQTMPQKYVYIFIIIIHMHGERGSDK